MEERVSVGTGWFLTGKMSLQGSALVSNCCKEHACLLTFLQSEEFAHWNSNINSQILHFRGIVTWSSLWLYRLIEAFCSCSLKLSISFFFFFAVANWPLSSNSRCKACVLTICHSVQWKKLVFIFFLNILYPNAQHTSSNTKRKVKKAVFDVQKRDGQPAGSKTKN